MYLAVFCLLVGEIYTTTYSVYFLLNFGREWNIYVPVSAASQAAPYRVFENNSHLKSKPTLFSVLRNLIHKAWDGLQLARLDMSEFVDEPKNLCYFLVVHFFVLVWHNFHSFWMFFCGNPVANVVYIYVLPTGQWQKAWGASKNKIKIKYYQKIKIHHWFLHIFSLLAHLRVTQLFLLHFTLQHR